MEGEYQEIAQKLASQVSDQLPSILNGLLDGGFNPRDQPLQLQCHLTPAGPAANNQDNQVQIASVDLGNRLTTRTSRNGGFVDYQQGFPQERENVKNVVSSWSRNTWPARNTPITTQDDSDSRPNKRRKDVGSTSNASHKSLTEDVSHNACVVKRNEAGAKVQQSKRPSDNPSLQPSSLEKFISGIWDSLFSGLRMDPTEIVEQWQAIESSGQPRLLTDSGQDVARRNDHGAFGRMSVLTRKISQTTKACRSLEVIVQAHWVQCFDDRVEELAAGLTRDKAKKNAIAEACVDFNWTEKELRNKMAIWRGYHEIKNAAGWVALVFAGMGLYRFCKYRVSFTDSAFRVLRHLRHRFEVAADTLHPRWRYLLGLVGGPTEPKYNGHPHDWVVDGPGDEAIPLSQTYHQWDRDFSYVHLNKSIVDEDAWGDFDPRTVIAESDPAAYKCQNCGEQQSSNPTQNSCACYPNLYGSPKAGIAPVQVFRTPNGKNNGLIACCSFEKGLAVGEFVGEITTGITGLDVMVDRTDRAGYQIWQGRKGNHLRFCNHSCEPNTHYERFVWLCKQRTVLVSDGIEAGDEVTVDYGDIYWTDLDKECLCNKPNCRYQRRHVQQLVTPPNGNAEAG